MPVKMELRENERVIYYDITDPWTLGEFRALYTRNQIIRDQHDRIIHAVANLSASQHLPRDILNAMHFSPDIRHSRAGYVYFVGPTPFVRKMIETAVRLLHTTKFQIISTEEEAWDAVRDAIRREAS